MESPFSSTVKIWGPPDGRPVLAMPGWLDNAGTFDTLIPLLPKDLRIVVVDTPGHGWSDPFPPDIAYNSLDGLVAIERMTKHFKWNKFSLMGHSVGGVLAMLYSGIFPEKVEKLVTLDVVRGIPTIPEKVDRRLRNIVEKLLQYEEDIIAGPEKPISYETAIRRSVRGTLGSLDEKASEIMFKRGLKQVEGGYALTRDRRMLTAPLIFWPKEDQLVLARKVTADVLIIKFLDGPYFESEEDYLEHVEALKTKSKNVQYVEVEGQHHAHLTHPERIAPIISKFFSLANNS